MSSLTSELFYCHNSCVREKVLFIEGYPIGENEIKKKRTAETNSHIKRGKKIRPKGDKQ
jgi:hypothetical protein